MRWNFQKLWLKSFLFCKCFEETSVFATHPKQVLHFNYFASLQTSRYYQTFWLQPAKVHDILYSVYTLKSSSFNSNLNTLQISYMEFETTCCYWIFPKKLFFNPNRNFSSLNSSSLKATCLLTNRNSSLRFSISWVEKSRSI